MWEVYKIGYHAVSPVHIGWHALGQIRRTRRYIPAVNVWGAWTAAWARTGLFGQDTGAYRLAEEDLSRWLRFTGLFPQDAGGGWLRPKYREAGLQYGQLTAGQFDARYVHGVASAAIEPETFTAQEGMLHEREYLHGRDLRLGGYVLLNAGGRWPELWAAVKRLTIGGNQGYGYGLLEGSEPVRAGEALFGEYHLGEMTGGKGEMRAALTAESGATLAGFATGFLVASGEQEKLSGRGWGQSGAGQAVSPYAVAWCPGSVLQEPAQFALSARGLWEAYKA